MLHSMQPAAASMPLASSLQLGDSVGVSMDSSSRGAGQLEVCMTAPAAANTATAPTVVTAAGEGGSTAAAQSGSNAAGLSVPGLAVLLQEVLADKQKGKQQMVVVRSLSRLLHGQDVDLSTVQVAEVLPQLYVLLQHMRDR